MTEFYVLDGHEPIRATLEEWGKMMDDVRARKVAQTEISDEIMVSTVFMGIDHSWGLGGPPLFFETMVFGGKLDGEQERYTTWDEAAKGHEETVRRVRDAEE